MIYAHLQSKAGMVKYTYLILHSYIITEYSKMSYLLGTMRKFDVWTPYYNLNLEACQYFNFLLPTFIALYVASQTENLCIIFLLYVYIRLM